MSRTEAVARAEELAERLALAAPASVKPMFGGAAVMVDGAMVAFVSGGTVYLRVDAATKAEFEARGVAPFTYERAGKPAALQHYYPAPDDVFDDDEALRAVAKGSLAAALAAKAPKRRSPARTRPRTGAKPKPKPRAT